MTSKQCFNLY